MKLCGLKLALEIDALFLDHQNKKPRLLNKMKKKPLCLTHCIIPTSPKICDTIAEQQMLKTFDN